MAVSRTILGFVVLLLFTFSSLVLYLHFADMNHYRSDIEGWVSNSIGRELTIEGDFQLDLLPAPLLVLNDVTLTNAVWGSEPAMAKIKHLAVRVDISSLLSGPIQVEEFILDEFSLLLELDGKGRANWEFDAADQNAIELPADENANDEAIFPLLLHAAKISNAVIVYRQPGYEDHFFRLDDFVVTTNKDENLAFWAKGKVLSLPLSLSGEFNSWSRLKALDGGGMQLKAKLGDLELEAITKFESLTVLDGSSVKAKLNAENIDGLIEAAGLSLPISGPLNLDVEILQNRQEIEIKLDGEISDIASEANIKLQGSKIEFDAKLATLDRIAGLFDITGLPAKPILVQGKAKLGSDLIKLQALKVQLDSAQLNVSGKLAGGDGVSLLTLDARGDTLSELMADLPPLPFKIKTVAEFSSSALKLDLLRLTVGESDLAGSVTLQMGDKKALSADLQSKRLDLRSFRKLNEMAGESPSVTAQETDKYLFVDKALPLELIQEHELDVNLSIERFISHAIELAELTLKGETAAGDLNMELNFVGRNGGEFSNKFKLVTSGEEAQLDVNIKASGLKFNVASEGKKRVPATNLSVDLKSKGNSPRQLAAASNGVVIVTQGPGRVDNQLLSRFTGDILKQIFSELNPLSKKDEYTNWECSVIAVNIVDGLSELSTFLLQGEKIVVLGGGQLDLKTEQLDIEFKTKPRQGIGITADMFVTPFIALRGTLANPSVGLNKKGTLFTGGAAFATGGISFLVQGASNRVTAEADHCEQALAELSTH